MKRRRKYKKSNKKELALMSPLELRIYRMESMYSEQPSLRHVLPYKKKLEALKQQLEDEKV